MTHDHPPAASDIDCSWLSQSNDGHSRCGLLRQITGLSGDAACTVDPSACRDCLRWYPPTEAHLNPVVASLLYGISSEIADAGGCAECSADRAQQLKQRALNCIPHDYDSHPVADDIYEQLNTGIPDIAALIPRPPKRFGPAVTNWAVAVTTAPREQETLGHCLSSLTTAGWAEPRIVVDGDVTLPTEWKHLPVTCRQPQIGAWPSYFLTMAELYMRSPNADAYMIVQDDVVFFRHPEVRRYVESVLWPARTPGIASLFCSRGHAPPNRGWHLLKERLVWGGPVMIYSRNVMMKLLADPDIIAHRLSDDGLVSTSRPIGKWALATNTPVHLCAPSLVQHIGHVSSLFADVKAFSCRSAAEFSGRCSLQNPDGHDS